MTQKLVRDIDLIVQSFMDMMKQSEGVVEDLQKYLQEETSKIGLTTQQMEAEEEDEQ